MVPKAAGHRKLINRLLHWLSVDKVNDVHDRYCDNPGPEFSRNLLKDFDINLRVDGREVLDSLPDGAFITVSNHPFGALDGISLIALMGTLRPDFKVMVNMVLNRISAMRPNFIAVDALASDDPAKQTVQQERHHGGYTSGTFGPSARILSAGAVSKINRSLRIEDREWQPTIIRLVRQMGVPVVPIYFHGHNSALFNILGVISWQLRTLRLPTEVWRKCHSTIHISVGNIIPAEKIKEFGDNDKALGEFLKASTYELRKRK